MTFSCIFAPNIKMFFSSELMVPASRYANSRRSVYRLKVGSVHLKVQKRHFLLGSVGETKDGRQTLRSSQLWCFWWNFSFLMLSENNKKSFFKKIWSEGKKKNEIIKISESTFSFLTFLENRSTCFSEPETVKDEIRFLCFRSWPGTGSGIGPGTGTGPGSGPSSVLRFCSTLNLKVSAVLLSHRGRPAWTWSEPDSWRYRLGSEKLLKVRPTCGGQRQGQNQQAWYQGPVHLRAVATVLVEAPGSAAAAAKWSELVCSAEMKWNRKWWGAAVPGDTATHFSHTAAGNQLASAASAGTRGRAGPGPRTSRWSCRRRGKHLDSGGSPPGGSSNTTNVASFCLKIFIYLPKISSDPKYKTKMILETQAEKLKQLILPKRREIIWKNNLKPGCASWTLRIMGNVVRDRNCLLQVLCFSFSNSLIWERLQSNASHIQKVRVQRKHGKKEAQRGERPPEEAEVLPGDGGGGEPLIHTNTLAKIQPGWNSYILKCFNTLYNVSL